MGGRSTIGARFTWVRLAALVSALLLAGTTIDARAEKKSYRYEDDPVRLGMKALDEARMDDARNYFNEAIQNEHQVYRAHYGLGLLLYRQGEYENAEPLFRQSLIEKNQETGAADYPEAHAALGLVLLRLQRSAEAKQEFSQALREKAGLWEAQYGMARLLIESKNYDEAEKYLEKGSRKKTVLEGADLYQYGEALVKVGRDDLLGAEKHALAAMNMNPNDPEYITLVADIETKRGAIPIAIEAYEKAISTPGLMVTAPTHANLGALYEQVQRYNDALRQYQEAVKADSTYAPAVKKMAALYALANRNEEAAIAYTSYASLRRDDAEGFLGLADACLKTKRFRQAYEAAQQAFILDSTSVKVRLTLARAAFQNKERGRAAALYDALADTVRLEAGDYVKKGQMELEAKQFDEADRDLTRAVKMDSTQADAYFALGLKDLQIGKPDSALLHFDKAVALAPTSSGAWLNRGITQMQLKDNSGSVRSLREAVRLSPEYAPGRIYLAQGLVAADSIMAAQVEYKAVLDKDPKNAMALRGLGYCYLRSKPPRFQQAVTTFREATGVEPNNPDAWYMLGQALGSAGDVQGGIAAEEKALELKPDHQGAKNVLEILRKASKPSGGK